MSKLAILGGTPFIKKEFKSYNSIGKEEIASVNRVMEAGSLSEFLGVWGEFFNGGPQVKEFELAWSRRFSVKHSISVNSATSGLFAAMGAVGISPGDEVIVPPFTMSATVMAPLLYGGIPVFADIDAQTFCIDVEQVEKKITAKTKAIIAVNLFGHAAELKRLRKLADARNLYLIEDNSQGPLCSENGKLAGTIGHIGIFSLNYHKHIHTGEGGVCVTDNDDLALRLQLIRNHGENAVEPAEIIDLANMIGFNYRLTEVSAAIGIEQLKKLDRLVDERQQAALSLTNMLSDVPGLTPPAIRTGCNHVFYVWSAKVDSKITGVPRHIIFEALAAEGLAKMGSYVKPLYLLPVFQKRIAIGNQGFPFTHSQNLTYEKGLCPVTERMFEEEIMVFPICSFSLTKDDVELVAGAIRKVFDCKDELLRFAGSKSANCGVVS